MYTMQTNDVNLELPITLSTENCLATATAKVSRHLSTRSNDQHGKILFTKERLILIVAASVVSLVRAFP